MLEAQEPPLLAARQQDGQTGMLLTRPELLAVPWLEDQKGHRLVAGPLQGRTPRRGVVTPSTEEPWSAVDQQGLTGRGPRLPEEPPDGPVPRRLQHPGDLAV